MLQRIKLCYVNCRVLTKRVYHWGADYPNGEFPNCHDQLVVDYCRITNEVINYGPVSSVTWEAGGYLLIGDYRATYWNLTLGMTGTDSVNIFEPEVRYKNSATSSVNLISKIFGS